MAAYTSTALTIASLVASAAGAGYSFYSQQQQAANAQDIANQNYRIQQENARVSAEIAQRQAQWNQEAALARQQAQLNNATQYEIQARAVEAQGREQARRMREENERRQAMQRARYAKGGVTSEGSPLAVLAESAGLLELAVQDQAFQTDMESRAWKRKAAGERFESGFSLLDAQVAKYEQAAAGAGLSIALNQAKADKAAGYSAAAGYRQASYGTLLTGFSSAANQASGYNWATGTKKSAIVNAVGN